MNHDKANQVQSRYWMKLVAVFTLGWLVIYAARTILNPLMGHIKTEFTLNIAQLALIMSLFFSVISSQALPFLKWG